MCRCIYYIFTQDPVVSAVYCLICSSFSSWLLFKHLRHSTSPMASAVFYHFDDLKEEPLSLILWIWHLVWGDCYIKHFWLATSMVKVKFSLGNYNYLIMAREGCGDGKMIFWCRKLNMIGGLQCQNDTLCAPNYPLWHLYGFVPL